MKRFDLLKNAGAALPHDDDAMSTDNLDVVDRLQKMAWEAGHSCVILCYLVLSCVSLTATLVVQLSDTPNTPPGPLLAPRDGQALGPRAARQPPEAACEPPEQANAQGGGRGGGERGGGSREGAVALKGFARGFELLAVLLAVLLEVFLAVRP
jgi:hypothetical protein